MHIADVDTGNLGANGIVGGGIPIAVGAALAQKLTGSGKVVVSFFGDGAANEGAFHEAANMAAVWQLPVVFVCENNHYGMSMAADQAFALLWRQTLRTFGVDSAQRCNVCGQFGISFQSQVIKIR